MKFLMSAEDSIRWENGKKKYNLIIREDKDAETPRRNADTNVATLATWGLAQDIGDEVLAKRERSDIYNTPYRYWLRLARKYHPEADGVCVDDFVHAMDEDIYCEVIYRTEKTERSPEDLVLAPFGSFPAADSWTTKVVGYGFVKKEDILNKPLDFELDSDGRPVNPKLVSETNWKKVAKDILYREMSVFSAYYRGENYRYELFCKTSKGAPWKLIGLKGGFCGGNIVTNGIVDSVGNGLLDAIKAETVELHSWFEEA